MKKAVTSFVILFFIFFLSAAAQNNHNNKNNIKVIRSKAPRTSSNYKYPSGLSFGNDITAGFFVNWALYRSDGYTFTVANLTREFIESLDIIYYGFAFFCPNATMTHPYWTLNQDKRLTICSNDDSDAFKLTWIDPHDASNIAQLQSMRDNWNPSLKIVLSIGGWTFPSNFFSQMASYSVSRNKLIASIVNFTNTFSLDGVDFDWEYPFSAPRVNPVEITPEIFKFVVDEGGASYDKENFVIFLTDLRKQSNMTNKLITICGQAGLTIVDNGFDIKSITNVVDFINIMTYDYTVSATNSSANSGFTAPNEPYRQPTVNGDSNIALWNVTGTIVGYISRGGPPEQLLVGIALYGHDWYLPGCDVYDTECWNSFNLAATYPGPNITTCSNVTASYWSAGAGKYTKECGFHGIFEIELAGFLDSALYDNETGCYIAYIDEPGADDGWTKAGTWMSWLAPDGIKEIISFAKSLGIPGGFVFDFSTDSHRNGNWTFEYFYTMSNCIKDDSYC